MGNQSWDIAADFVSIGSGIGGLAGAITAHDGGLRAVVLEKSPSLGGVTAYSMGQVWVPANHVALAQGIHDSTDEAMAYLRFLGGGYEVPELQQRLLDASIESCRYFAERAGVAWQVCPHYPDYYFGDAPGTLAEGRYLDVAPIEGTSLGEWAAQTRLSPHVPNGITHEDLHRWGGAASIGSWDFNLMAQRIAADLRTLGPGLAAYFVKAALVDRSIRAYVGAPAVRLIHEEGRVVGVEAMIDGRAQRIGPTRGVLLATGAYAWAEDAFKYFDHRPTWESAAPPSVAGDHLVMAGEVGAAVAVLPEINVAVPGYRIPGEEHDGRPLFRLLFGTGMPHGIMVNRAGRRFGDESFYRQYQPELNRWDGGAQEHPNLPYFLIFDQQYRDKYAFATAMPGENLPEGLAVCAETIGELGAALGVDSVELERTIERFNDFSRRGVDEDFGRGSRHYSNHYGDLECQPNPNLGTLERPPFYGIELATVSTGADAAGLRFDRHARVAHLRGGPIEGLYVAGNSAAYLDVGAGYQSGIANARGMAWGYVAGRHAAGLEG